MNAHNFRGGVMLGTEMHNWWRLDPDKWFTVESEHFRHCVDQEKMAKWPEKRMQEFKDRIPQMFAMAELIYHTYSERLAMRSSVVSRRPERRGDGIRYKTPIRPSNGSWNHLAAAESCRKFLLHLRRNPCREVLLPHGPLVAARLNAEQRRASPDAAGGLRRAGGRDRGGQPAYPRGRSQLDRRCGGELAKCPTLIPLQI